MRKIKYYRSHLGIFYYGIYLFFLCLITTIIINPAEKIIPQIGSKIFAVSPVFTVLDVPFNDLPSIVLGEVFFVSDKLLSVPVNISLVLGVFPELFSFLYASSAVVNTSTLLTIAF